VATLLGLPEREANAAGVADARCGAQRTARHPQGLGVMGLQQDIVEKIADGAMGDHCHLSTPRQPDQGRVCATDRAKLGLTTTRISWHACWERGSPEPLFLRLATSHERL
jgi:hypothetical protein